MQLTQVKTSFSNSAKLKVDLVLTTHFSQCHTWHISHSTQVDGALPFCPRNGVLHFSTRTRLELFEAPPPLLHFSSAARGFSSAAECGGRQRISIFAFPASSSTSTSRWLPCSSKMSSADLSSKRSQSRARTLLTRFLDLGVSHSCPASKHVSRYPAWMQP